MSYLQFLLRWYNLIFLALGLSGVGAWIVARARTRRMPVASGTLIGTCVAGLTFNGAIHDLALGDPAPRFPLVLIASVAVAFVFAYGYRRLTDRYFPPVRRIEIDSPGLVGLEGRLVSQGVDREPRSGRAHCHDGGVLHLVHCHTMEEELRCGRTIRLEAYDEASRSYRVTAD